ncbi:hypothetical protein [Sediminibacterium goheungense]|uniref:Uncharacterized protein n=1 Tax=Sediminibacterium goheungense TaxID=1086393 RepID=A0A4R6IUZ7_9BACT|nr:hypothetical protein [Sediminibacterium goheungense]TDO25695.1 hypothetical protein BC659_2617 [Sediminibacterium goheungense]
MRQLLVFITLSFALLSCTKESEKPVYTVPDPIFKATVSGIEVGFENKITVTSEKIVEGGKHLLRISAERKLSNDSSTLIQFMVEDFTRNNTGGSKTFPLTTNFPGHFIEWKETTNSTHGKYHFFQSGQLVIEQIGADYISGSFQFTYFTFDQQANKTGEYPIQGGRFSHLKIKRIN